MQAILLNIRHGGGHRARRLLEWLDERSPDVIVMPEWRDSSPALRTGLEQQGFQVDTTNLRTKLNGVLFAARDRNALSFDTDFRCPLIPLTRAEPLRIGHSRKSAAGASVIDG